MKLMKSLSIEQHVADKVMVNWFCYLCGSICYSLKLYLGHVNGQKHNTLYAKLSSPQHGTLKRNLVSQLNNLPKKGANLTGGLLPRSALGQAAQKKGVLKAMPRQTCPRCFRYYTCSQEEHLQSEEHKKFEGIRPRCNVCNQIFQKIKQYRKHLKTAAHKKRVAGANQPSTSKDVPPSPEETKIIEKPAETKKPAVQVQRDIKSIVIDMSHVWVVGDDAVISAGRSDPRQGPSDRVRWLGVPDAKLPALVPAVRGHLESGPAPLILVVHVGAHDIFAVPVADVRARIEEVLKALRELLPGARIIWSNILARLFYYGAEKAGVGKHLRRALNRFALKTCKENGLQAISHQDNIKASDHSLFQRDGMSLSEKGCRHFRDNIYKGIHYLGSQPEAVSFPPR